MYRSRLDIRVRADERDQWHQWSEELGLGLSEMVRRAIPAYYHAMMAVRAKTGIQVLSVPERDRRSDTKAVAR